MWYFKKNCDHVNAKDDSITTLLKELSNLFLFTYISISKDALKVDIINSLIQWVLLFVG